MFLPTNLPIIFFTKSASNSIHLPPECLLKNKEINNQETLWTIISIELMEH